MAFGVGLALVTCLLWSSVGIDDDVAEVVARRGEVLEGRFIEVPCSEDYDGHRRFEGMCHRLLSKLEWLVGAGDMAQHSRTFVEFPEDQISVPNTLDWQLTAACNFTFRRSNFSCRHLRLCAYSYTQTHRT